MMSCLEMFWGVLVWLVTRSLREWTLLVELGMGVGQVIKCRIETLLVGQGSVLALREPCLHPHPWVQLSLATVRNQEGPSSHQASIRDVVGKGNHTGHLPKTGTPSSI